MGWFGWAVVALVIAIIVYFLGVPIIFKLCVGAAIILFVLGIATYFIGKLPKGDPS
jgi:hypothetical protein